MADRGVILPQKLVAQIQGLRAAGFTLRGIGRVLHLSRNTVRRYCRPAPPLPIETRRAA
jgi:hypothetical protein